MLSRPEILQSFSGICAPPRHCLSPNTWASRPQRSRNTTVAALGFFRKQIATSGGVDDILAVVESTERGCNTSRSQRASIDAALGVLEGAGDKTSLFNKGLSATWKLLWTTEKVRCAPVDSSFCIV